ncbi:UDP-forming cellulose synthase catalytic subunit [Alcanivorax sp. MM125-6]|nr:UDP-forming cellulose synthase catalytic subunit [Alcanivorax sp. MM125-6]
MLALAVLLAIPPLILFITTPMDAAHQIVLGIAGALLAILAHRLSPDSRRASLCLILLSMVVSSRYLYWRITETLVFQTGFEYVLGYGLFVAELYAWTIMFFGYIQTLYPLERGIVPMPEDLDEWPTVDVYIPTYNEELSVVMDTVLAAQELEYPADKMNIYLLDDGGRQSFAAFAARAGVGYIAREEHNHAKAGNLNHAMGLTDGELICVFDCDHIPTTGFLQSTVGGFCTDPGLSMLQTPHYFYSQDPFERNLAAGDGLPREGELFYGPVQKGNDFWNATFFCGSCAVIRRSALDEVDGFAVETVTEDAHTALKMQRKGWRTAFLGLPLAAGLATERLSLHIGQRARWARGMTQILRLDNPLFGRGLTLAQRLCYLNAALHFMFPLPRVVFLTAPLAYLLIGQNIIASSAQMILAYALPHLFHAIYTNSRLNGRYRHTFWGEIYETSLCFHLVKPTLVTFFSPRRGKFNVTEKGGLLNETFFDVDPVKPHLVVAFMLLAGLGWGVVRLFWHEYYGVQPDVMALNLFWGGFSLFILLATIAVARERRQVRGSVRVNLGLPATLYLADGHTLATRTVDLSMTGARVRNPGGEPPDHAVEFMEVRMDGRSVLLPAEMMGGDRRYIRLRLGQLDINQRRQLVRIVMGRADAWLAEGERRQDHPLKAFWPVMRCVLGLFMPDLMSRDAEEREANRVFHQGKLWRWIMPIAMLFLVAVLALLAVRPAMAQAQVASVPEPVSARPLPSSARTVTLAQLGQPDGVSLTGDGAQGGVGLSLPSDEVVVGARMTLRLRHDPALANGKGELVVTMNGEPVQRLTLREGDGEVHEHRFQINPSLMLDHNQLGFRLFGVADQTCPNPLDPRVHARVMAGSSLDLAVERLPLANRLDTLPVPFFDPNASGPVGLNMALANPADPDQVHAAALVASWFGAQNRYRRLRWTVDKSLPDDNAVVFVTNDQPLPGLNLGPVGEPGIRMTDNPNGRGKLLVLAAPDSAGLVQAARFLLHPTAPLRGQRMVAEPVSTPVSRPYDAPRWNAGDAVPLRLGDLVTPDQLRVSGITPALIRVPFRMAPDLDLWPGDTVPLRIRYRFPDGEWLDTDKSRLDVALNGQYLGSLPVTRRGLFEHLWGLAAGPLRQEEAVLPVPPSLIHGQNELTFYFNLAHHFPDPCNVVLPTDVVSQVYPDSTLDLTETWHLAEVPDLRPFLAAGYPFTVRADLSQSALVLPENPTLATLDGAFTQLARIAEATGVAGDKLAVALGRDQLRAVADRHWLALTPLSDPLAGSLLREPYYFYEGHLRVRDLSLWERLKLWALHGDDLDRGDADRALSSRSRVQALFADRTPLNEERQMVLLATNQESTPGRLVAELADDGLRAELGEDLSLVDRQDEARNFRINPVSPDSDNGMITMVRWALGQRPDILLICALFVLVLIAGTMVPLLRARAARRLNEHGERKKR